MKITRNNYETFFIDYHDGVLTAEQVAELFLFLESNTDLKNDFESFASVQLDATDETFEFSDSLKRGEINEQNLSHYLIGSLEGDLSMNEQLLLNNYIQNSPVVNDEVKLFNATKLDSNIQEIYPDKKSLKQPVPFYFDFNRSINMAIAAILLLSIIAGSYFVYTKTMVKDEIKLAEVPEVSPMPAPVQNKIVESVVQQNNSEKLLEPIKVERNINNNTQLAGTRPLQKNVPVKQQDNKKIEEQLNNVPPQIINPTQNESVPLAEVKQEVAPVNKVNKSENNFATKSPIPAQIAPVTEEYISVWEALRQSASNNIRKITESEPSETLASSDDSKNNDLKILEVIGKGIEKVSNDKVQVDTQYNNEGKLSAFHFAAGKFKIERTSHD